MAVIYSTQFVSARLRTTGFHDLVTVPSGHRWVLRSISAVSSASVAMGMGLYLAGAPVFFAGDPALASGAEYQWSGRQVLNEGDTLGVYCDEFPLSVLVSRYDLTL